MFIFNADFMFAMKENFRFILSLFFLAVILQVQNSDAQDPDSAGYEFTPLKVINATPVKNQYNSNTCWSFAVISLLESELLRTNKGYYDLSEMFIVKYAYAAKAIKYVRMHGHINFTGGGVANDVIDVIKGYGIVPERIYPVNKDNLIQCEMDSVLKDYVNIVINNKSNKLNPGWFNDYMRILDSYLGEVPDTFEYDSIIYTPEKYAEDLELDMDDYILITSYTHHPYYSKFILEVPDNWSWGEVYNVPLEELIEIIDSAVYNNYTIVWTTDISERGFSFTNGLAIIPEINYENMNEEEHTIWDLLPQEKRDKLLHNFMKPGLEKIITQEIRQEGFNDYATTDDHGMQIIGIAQDQNKTKYYYVKNSWGTNNIYNGYLYASEAYVKYKTMSIMLNKNAIPEKIARKLKADI